MTKQMWAGRVDPSGRQVLSHLPCCRGAAFLMGKPTEALGRWGVGTWLGSLVALAPAANMELGGITGALRLHFHTVCYLSSFSPAVCFSNFLFDALISVLHLTCQNAHWDSHVESSCQLSE